MTPDPHHAHANAVAAYSIAIDYDGARPRQASAYTMEMTLDEAVEACRAMLNRRRDGATATVFRTFSTGSVVRYAILTRIAGAATVTFFCDAGELIVQAFGG